MSRKPKRKTIRRKRKPAVRLYRMTIATFHYDKPTHQLIEYEMHFKIARRGDIKRVRRRLAKLGAAYFQRWLRRAREISVPRRKLKIAFEREARAYVEQFAATVRTFIMRRERRRWVAQELLLRTMSYVRRRRRRKRRVRR